jgi:2-amino-4-hydroxy-6-hydroxymethyldihydropteridine diphosphokinase
LNKAVPVAVALGSNLGDRGAQLDFAVARLSTLLTDLTVSPRVDTVPVDVVGEQPMYLNAAAIGRTSLGPHDLLRALQAIESAAGRERPYPNAPRTLDVDLIFYDDLVIAEPQLQLPHPRFRDRLFVLEPLAAIAPGWCDPVTGASVLALLERCRRG